MVCFAHKVQSCEASGRYQSAGSFTAFAEQKRLPRAERFLLLCHSHGRAYCEPGVGCPNVHRFLFSPLSSKVPGVFSGWAAGLGQTVRVGRAQLHRARSASTGAPIPLRSSLPRRSLLKVFDGWCRAGAQARAAGDPTPGGGASTLGLLDNRTRRYTGHFSSFHAISQNIHSYRELMTNASSIRRFSSFPAVFTHWSTFFLIHC